MDAIQLSESLFPADTSEPIWETTVGDLLREVTARDPSAPALVEIDVDGERGRRWSYGELLADSERVAVWAPNIPEWVLMEYACTLAGLVLVTANPAFQARELRYVLEHSGAVALFLIERYRGNPMAAIAAEAVEGLAAIREVVDLKDAQALHRHDGDAPCALPNVSPGDAAQIQYTSGTTGFPKGAVLGHRGLVNNARFYAARCRTRRDSTWINIMPMFHASGCGMVTLGSLSAGCPMVLVALFDPASVVRQIERERVTCILGVPTMLVGLLEHLERHPADLSSVEMVSSGGAMVAPELVRKTREIFGCFVRAEDGAPLDVEDLRRHCRTHLSPQKTPTVWCRVDEFPLTGSRKIQKFRLREQFLAGEHEPL